MSTETIVTAKNPGDRKIVKLSHVRNLALAAREGARRPRRAADDTETATHRRQIGAHVARIKRIALTSKNETDRIEAIQQLAALVLVKALAEQDMKEAAA